MTDYKKIIVEYQEFIKKLTIKHRGYFIDTAMNYVITGVRRSGKTWFLFQIIKTYFQDNIEKVLYINFEDDRFLDFTVNDFDKLLDSYYELYPSAKPVLFLDEIQNIGGWQNFCRRVADQKYRVYITGSNAKMLSSDIASTLGGRFMTLEMNPLSFPEFLDFNGINFSKNDIYSGKINKMKNLFGTYFNYGGFPEMLNVSDKRGYLHNIFTTVFYSDIVAKNKIRDTQGIRLLIKKLAESTNDELSYTRIRNLINATDLKTGTPTIIYWIENLKNAFLINDIRNINYKFSERESKKKYYFVDNGLLFTMGEQSGVKLLETLTFNLLRKYYGDEIYFFKSKNEEVDFVVDDKMLVQASYDSSDIKTKEREIKSLLKAADFLEINNLYIITYDMDDKIEIGGKTVKIIPLWKAVLLKTVFD